jgi:phosphoribosylanthranilate isomerase
MTRTRVKICGVRDLETSLAAAEAGADAIGYVFAPGSTRYIEPAEAWGIVSALPPMVTSVGIFVNASVDSFCDIEEVCPTNYAQLAGSENERLARECGPGVFKTIRIDMATFRGELERWNAIEEVEALVLDAPPVEGFDWATLLPHLEGIDKPLMLSGNLTAENVGAAIRAIRPYAVNVSDGVEHERGVKDPKLIEAFCRAVQAADATF